jgi:hypothetical protein
LALLTQQVLDWMRETRARRVKIYGTLMSLRATPMHPDYLSALNSIDTIFDRSEDDKVRGA